MRSRSKLFLGSVMISLAHDDVSALASGRDVPSRTSILPLSELHVLLILIFLFILISVTLWFWLF
ncbi:hypothetical protein [Anaplasma phagocytophilum]|uniref:hypothetical protein n=1 Tax=Anaplasma phagocytophilum TaxID=948 RepID=UPI00201AFD17